MREASYSYPDSGGLAGADVDPADREKNIFGTRGKATEFFIPESYRLFQRETIEEIESAYEQGFRHVVVDAPTGSGKSHIARALAFQAGDTHILTIQKLLQDQYQSDFPDMFVMKGRNAYDCLLGEGDVTCADGPCRLKKRAACDGCPYKIAKARAMSAPVTVHNFDSFYYQNSFGHGFGGRKLIIIDECHNIASKFSEFLSFTINSRGGIEVPEADSISQYDRFVKTAYGEYVDELSRLEAQFDVDGLSKENLYRMQELSRIVHRMKRYITEREKDNPAEYVFDYSTFGRYAPSVTFRPVYVGDYASRWLFEYGERSLMMSATILDKEMFCKEVGLNPSEVYYISVPSTFPAENRPIVKKYAGKMGYRDIDFTLPTLVEYIEEILAAYPTRKGIIQTHSEKIASYLKENIDDRRLTFNKDFDSPQDMLEVHAKKEGSIIVASGLREGLDLRGDLSKLQIFCKVPYPSLGDKVVARKLELDPEWYGWMTALMLIQSLGRSVRSNKERAVTYILDSGFDLFCKRYRKFIPEYVREAIKK